MKFLKQHWYFIFIILLTLGLGVATYITTQRIAQTKPVTPELPKATTPACTLTFTLPAPSPTPPCVPPPASCQINEVGLPYQSIRQIFVNDGGTRVYYRTCLWDAKNTGPIGCSPSDNVWNEQNIVDITEPGNPSYRLYAAFTYDIKGSTTTDDRTTSTPTQNIRQYYLDRTGTKVYYRTCHWDNVRNVADNCTPASGWISTNISNVTGTGDNSYRAYRAFIFDVPGQTPWPQSIRQIYLNENGTKTYYRTCQWNSDRASAENCNPASDWNIVNVSEAILGQTSIRDYFGFVFDTKDSSGKKIQKLRQGYLTEDGLSTYYRTCNWDPVRASSDCTAQTPWTQVKIADVVKPPVSQKMSRFGVFIWDTKCAVAEPPGGWCPGPKPTGVPTPTVTPTPTCTPRPACLDAKPPCALPEPPGGWCPTGPTPTPTNTPTATPTGTPGPTATPTGTPGPTATATPIITTTPQPTTPPGEPTPTLLPGQPTPTLTPPTPKVPVSGSQTLLGGSIIIGGLLLLLLGLVF